MLNNEFSNTKLSILKLISQITGHNIEDLEVDMYLEGDLGFDSIKMVTLMNELMKLIPKDEVGDFTKQYPVESLMVLDTIGDIVDVFHQWNSSKNNDFDELQTNNKVNENEISKNEDVDKEQQLEISNAQYPFLASYWAVGTITICSGVKVRGKLNIDYLWESWKELISHHPILRSYFKVSEDIKAFKEYKLVALKNPVPEKITLQDIRHLAVEEQNKEIKQTIENLINKKFNIFKWPLHNIMVIQTKDLEYEIIFSNNHLISDGLGNQQIIKELLGLYGAKISGKEFKLSNKIDVTDYNEIIEKINSWKDVEDEKNLQEYLKKQGKGKYFFNPYEKSKKVTHPYADVKSIKYWIDKDVVNKLVLCTKAFRVSLFTLIVSAYLKTIKEKDREAKNIIFNLPTGGKIYPNVDATGVLGCFAQNLALSFYFEEDNENWETLIKRVDKEIKNAIAAGFDREQIYQAASEVREKEMLEHGEMSELTSAFIRASLKSNLYLSFVGNTNINEYYEDINVYDYEAYTSTNAGAIDNLVEIFQGKMLISSNYDSSFFKKEYVDSVIKSLINNIEELVSYNLQSQTINEKSTSYKSNVIDEVCNLFKEICCVSINNNDIDKDLEAEFGMDSLERIRIITRITKIYKNVNKNALFECRTLREILSVIDKGIESGSKEEVNDYENILDIQIPYMKIIQQCKETPNEIAILYKDEKITYRELDNLSNKVANYLRAQGVKKGSLVGIMTLPGSLMLIGMLGILKSGAAYVPVDATYPMDRIRYIINHAKIQILLTENSLKDQLANLLEDDENIQGVIFLDYGQPIQGAVSFVQVEKSTWNEYPSDAPQYVNSADDLMLIIYTSGSTGNPKGVMLTHEGYMNRLEWHQKMFNLKVGERVAQKTSCCFDISIWELFWPLMYGGTVCPVRKEIVRNPWRLAEWIIENRINIMHFVPSLFGEFVHTIEEDNYEFKDLRWLIYSGEALPMSFIQKWIDRYGMSTGLANLYGPTEASIDVTYHIIEKRPGSDGELSIPIGKPVDNVYILNLDENMKELPVGEIGELWIGGIQVAKGYLNNLEKTAEAFKPNPFKEIPGEYLYKTGDLTSKNPGGSYEYHGRIDNQIKIRGFRVELGEIEAALDSHPNVKEAAVIAIDHGLSQKRLVACLSGIPVDDKEIKGKISSKLPEYMIPHSIQWLESLPKTPNGKVDRKALVNIVSVKGEVEANKVSIEPKTAEVAVEIEAKVSEITGAKQRAEVSTVPLAPAQKWLMNYFDYPYQWTGFTRFTFKQPLDFELFNKALTLLCNRHDILRCELVQERNKWIQKILPENLKVKADFYDGTHLSIEQRNNDVQNIIIKIIEELHVDRWPLWKVIVVKISENAYDISVVGHHLISDVITNKILFQDMWKIYAELLSGKEEVKLPPVKSYKDFILTVEKEKKDKGSKFIDYWKNKFPSEDHAFNIPFDFNKGPNDEKSAVTETFTLDKLSTSTLLGRAKKHFNTNVYSILLAPLYKMLNEVYNNSRVVVSHRVHGRNIGNNSFFETAGDFAVNFPLDINVEANDEIKDIVQKIKGSFDELPMNGVSYDLISDNLPLYMYPDTKLTPVRANYLGNRNLPNFESIEFSKESIDRRYSLPHQKRTSILEFFFSIVDEELKLEIEYSKNLFKDTTVKMLGDKYIETLKLMLSSVPQIASKHDLQFTESKVKGLLSDKVAVITGGGRGIGKAIALSMASEGAMVVIMARNVKQLEETAEEIRRLGSKAYIIATDITDIDRVKEEIDIVIKKFGKIDILVNNAGITKMASLLDTKPEEWKNIVNTNLFGTYNLCYTVVPYMIKQQGGRIINIGSDSALIGYPLMSAYSASKHGILGLTKSLSEELKIHNIQVNAVCPALVDTDMAPQAFKAKAIQPEKIAEVVMFLSSPGSDCITGETIKVYGKQDMYWFGSQQMVMLQGALKTR
ncbi:non-ribosomal peptide synthetase [Clostridium sp. DJ247]|uniref:non-ribosomal peptide synthetase n=1 Tax=Clostridium sp. DJ247 TaxID=2726188 RepID=UPI0016280927|nr:non-ribosomal peptide synthetase [Clostridium sp. DJ247]MBC2578804.1 amino acid adenylation domain-containing protein [Clostridium sp. DJ247]